MAVEAAMTTLRGWWQCEDGDENVFFKTQTKFIKLFLLVLIMNVKLI